MDFLLRCDFCITKLPVKLSKFHQQVLLYWKLIYSHNFTPHSVPIWNNRCILSRRKSLFFDDWVERGILSILHLMDSRGNFLDYDDFVNKFNLKCTKQQHSVVIKAIPQAMVNMVKGMLLCENRIPMMPALFIDDINFIDKKCTNKIIRGVLTSNLFPLSLKRKNLLKDYPEESIVRIRTGYLTLPISPKAKETHFKTLNDIYPCNEFLRQRFNIDKNNCTFCDSYTETLEHLFFSCTYTRVFWEAFQDWISEKDNQSPKLEYKDIKYGVIIQNKKQEMMYNSLIIIAKQFIHRCRFMKNHPLFLVYMN
ncbi:uncharacterized protein LOC126392755 isoform X1 [Epinephelus moara]|uniref:uncharacterized protein LOC126392755 isoform X1 n=1 Tax=Epinephelus moara TaxID=300413 RepID=UPI00214F5C2D|nr:uncharacterized protein LOC126392755 isoform X1 [Epinephelus moara]